MARAPRGAGFRRGGTAWRDGLASELSISSTLESSFDDAARGLTGDVDVTACDREPIHIPGAIQPHGLLLIANEATLEVIAGAGDLEGRLTPLWAGRRLDQLLAQDVASAIETLEPGEVLPLATVPGRSEAFAAIAHRRDGHVLVELETAPGVIASAADILSRLDRSASGFERSSDLTSLCECAAEAFRGLTGFDRVMIYRFLDDGAGLVLAEARDPALHSFLNHHFPATDIPRQARALYIRNRVRVIPDVNYAAAPIRPAAASGTDLSDIGLRSVSPIHIQYLRNMGVGASASISIVKDGLLWGLVACHHMSPRGIPYETRAACQALAGGLARQVRAKEEADTYRERIRLRGSEDAIVARGAEEASFERFIDQSGDDLRRMLGADGFAAIEGGTVRVEGVCPSGIELAELARWLAPRTVAEPFATRSLGAVYPPGLHFQKRASGVLAVTLHAETSMLLVWFRAEQRELVEWAGNPHHKRAADPSEMLTPRTSFEAWREEVSGLARPWTLAEVEAAARLRRQLFEARQSRRLRELNRELSATIADKEALIVQKDHLLREVNHRVQNSLQLVQAFLSMQEREDKSGELAARLGEAQRRISAVALVHRRLYQADQVETIDLARYLEELMGEMRGAMGEDWARSLTLDLAPILISADRAVNVGLVLTELVINANKYAYGGGSGPIAIILEEYRNQFRLIVADKGGGKTRAREGFGTRMMKAMVDGLGGTIEQFDNRPGLRVIITAPVSA